MSSPWTKPYIAYRGCDVLMCSRDEVRLCTELGTDDINKFLLVVANGDDPLLMDKQAKFN